MLTALFPGSFDPFTVGHKQIVEQSLRLFDKVVVGIGVNIEKQSMLSVENRRRLIEDALRGTDRVETVIYEGLTGELCKRLGASVIVRGVRSVADFEFERSLSDVNRLLYPSIDTVLLCAQPDTASVSSSAVREIVRFGGDASAMLPEGIRLEDYL